MIKALAEAKGEALSAERLAAYVQTLSDLPLAAVRLGMQRGIRESKFFPQASELHQWASWAWGRLWRERCPHEPMCSTPTRCELELDKEQRVTRYGEEAK